MSHEKYTTHAIILGSANVQDADKLFWLLTEEFGLIFASAKSVREETSKLRYVLQDLHESQVSLVRGRNIWRLTGAEECDAQKMSTEAQEAFGRIATLVRRVTPTDEENAELFAVVRNAHHALTTMDSKLIETLAVARVLYVLGYVSPKIEYKGLLDTVAYTHEVLQRVAHVENELVSDINAGLAESQL